MLGLHRSRSATLRRPSWLRRALGSRLAVVAAGAVLALGAPSAQRAATAYPSSTVTLTGHGWGHGRGMGQYGALGYALAGTGYRDILGRFYGQTNPGTIGNPQISVVLARVDGIDTIVTGGGPTGTVTVDGVAGSYAAVLVRRTGANTFSVSAALDCTGREAAGAPWSVQVTPGMGGPVTVRPTSTNAIQSCGLDGTRNYPGYLQAVDAGGTARTVNVAAMDDYLKGVVPRESPASWGDLGGGAGMQALKAQAVAARSYAWAENRYPYAKTCDTTSCQVYGGWGSNGTNLRDPRTDSAVDATSGEVRVLADGTVARTEFSSSTGGWSAGGSASCGCPPVADDGDATPSNANHTWTASIAVSDIEAKYGIGRLQRIDITARNGLGDLGGRVTSMDIVGSAGTVTRSGSQFQSDFGLKSNWFAITNGPSGGIMGYWIVAGDGGVFTFGGAPFFGSTGAMRLNSPIVGMARGPGASGYWLVAGDGGIFTFGAARFFGSTGNMRLNAPVLGMAPHPSGGGYWLFGADGGIFTFGSAGFFGSTGNMRLNQPVVGMAATPSGNGYWLVARDGGIFTFGDARFFGSTGNLRLNQPIVGMAATPSGNGYWLVARDGGIFAFGDAGYYGSVPGLGVSDTIVGISATATGGGYVLVAARGNAYSFGDAPSWGGIVDVVPGYRGGALAVVTVPSGS